ncbi:hypothetical protein CRENBAI_021384 [Crenichthys baileyi]|uniref:Uncharacterized protein n=1 Tax=Crenichthys baileyi TaxID=28760 RepID=A0AAV9SGY7_9TELE
MSRAPYNMQIMVHQSVFSVSLVAALRWITRHGRALQEYKPLVIETNKRRRNTPTERPNFSLSRRRIQRGSSLLLAQPVSAAPSWGLMLVCTADRKWHGRGGELSARSLVESATAEDRRAYGGVGVTLLTMSGGPITFLQIWRAKSRAGVSCTHAGMRQAGISREEVQAPEAGKLGGVKGRDDQMIGTTEGEGVAITAAVARGDAGGACALYVCVCVCEHVFQAPQGTATRHRHPRNRDLASEHECGRAAASCTGAREQNFEGGGKFIKHHYGDKSQQTASASRLLSIPVTQPNRKARPLRRARYAASPGDRYVTPPKTLWHNYTSVALKGEGGGEGVGWQLGRGWWSNPLGPSPPPVLPQPFEDASETFSLRHWAFFRADVSNEHYNSAEAMERGY